jgi:hypothetical protein
MLWPDAGQNLSSILLLWWNLAQSQWIALFFPLPGGRVLGRAAFVVLFRSAKRQPGLLMLVLQAF